MRFKEFLEDHYLKTLFRLICMAVVCTFLYLTGTPTGVILLLLIGWVLVSMIETGITYYRQRVRLAELFSIFDNLDKKYLLAECISRPDHFYERIMFDLLRRSAKAMTEEVSGAQALQKEYREYIESWVHEVKVPITTIQLMCRNEKSKNSNKILEQSAMIEEQVERALFYARLDSVERDFVINQTDLIQIIHESIGKYKQLFIRNHIQIEVEEMDIMVYTDTKWLSFILGQFFSNAIRYRSENPLIQIRATHTDTDIKLGITDNGIGIAAHELPRIFDRGFTGSNGRNRGGSTGMGLYIAKRVAEHLHIKLSAESVENEYTRFCLEIPGQNRSEQDQKLS